MLGENERENRRGGGIEMAKADTLRSVDKRAAKDAARQQARMNKTRYTQTDKITVKFTRNQVEFEKTRVFY